jgi:hypothetical protein
LFVKVISCDNLVRVDDVARQGNRKLKVEELHSDLQCPAPANTRIAPPQAAAKLNPRPFYYSDLAIALCCPSFY